jgi:hypothetical protein
MTHASKVATARRCLVSCAVLCLLAATWACTRSGVSPTAINYFLDGYCGLATQYTRSAIEAQEILREVRAIDRLPADLAARIDTHLLTRAVLPSDLQTLEQAEADLRLAAQTAAGAAQ